MRLDILIDSQSAELYDAAGVVMRRYRISSAAAGVGELRNSYCTPRGRHIVRAKIGQGAPVNTVFVRRRPTGEIYSPELSALAPERDWILTRILWLSGCQRGFNRLGNVDTMHRYIYIHGTPDQTSLGVPGSHGCIRMANRDIIELFDLLPVYSAVNVFESRDGNLEGDE